jgi:hypothetical protein
VTRYSELSEDCPRLVGATAVDWVGTAPVPRALPVADPVAPDMGEAGNVPGSKAGASSAGVDPVSRGAIDSVVVAPAGATVEPVAGETRAGMPDDDTEGAVVGQIWQAGKLPAAGTGA